MSKVLITHREQVRAHFGVGTATRTRRLSCRYW
jgi:hypothetical protein